MRPARVDGSASECRIPEQVATVGAFPNVGFGIGIGIGIGIGSHGTVRVPWGVPTVGAFPNRGIWHWYPRDGSCPVLQTRPWSFVLCPLLFVRRAVVLGPLGTSVENRGQVTKDQGRRTIDEINFPPQVEARDSFPPRPLRERGGGEGKLRAVATLGAFPNRGLWHW